MNFLKVKKYIGVFLFSFFISIGFVSAKDLTGFIHTSNSTRDYYSDSINLFEESYNRSGFMNLLYSKGNDIGNYLNTYFNIGNSSFFNSKFNYGISIMSYSEFKEYYNGASTYDNNYKSHSSDTPLLSSETLSGNLYYSYSWQSYDFAYYETKYLDGYSSSDIENIMIFSTTNGLENSTVYGVFTVNEEDALLTLYPKYIFLFNSNGDAIGYSSFGTDSSTIHQDMNNAWDNTYSSKRFKITFTFPFDSVNPDMTSWYGYTFKLNANSNNYDKIYPEYFWLNGYDDYVMVSENAGYSGISGWFKNLDSKYYDLDYYNLDFVYDDVFYNDGDKYSPLFDRWFDSSSFTIPTDYLYIDISDSKKGYYLIPKSSCSYNDYLLYYSGVSNLSVNALYFNYYNFSVSDNKLEIYKRFGVYSSKSYVNYSYNPLLDLGVTVDEFLEYAINAYQYTTKYSYFLYYNSSCYDVYLVSDNDITLSFNSGDYLLTSSEIQTNYNNDTVNGSNYVSGGTSASGGSSNGNVSNSTIIDGSVNTDTSYVSNVISNLGDYASGIIGSVESLVGMATVFLTGLPPIIYNFLFSVFAIGMLIFTIKLFK